MPTCDVCRERVDLPQHCTRCAGSYCGRHRLPESHDCVALEDWAAREATEGAGGDIATGGRTPRRRERPSPGSLRGWVAHLLDGRVTYLFLALMVVGFVGQTIVFPLAGFGPRSFVWQSVFVVSTAHPEFVWTWVTSVFAHGGVFHLVFNGVAIFFFGRLVEEYVGSRRYAVLFVLGGALAGISQIALLLVQGVDSGALGASGAAMAVLGVLTGVNPRLRVYLFFLIPVPIWLFTGGFAYITVTSIQTGGSTAGGVAHFAHLVGLVLGLLYGLYEKGRGRQLPERLRFTGVSR